METTKKTAKTIMRTLKVRSQRSNSLELASAMEWTAGDTVIQTMNSSNETVNPTMGKRWFLRTFNSMLTRNVMAATWANGIEYANP